MSIVRCSCCANCSSLYYALIYVLYIYICNMDIFIIHGYMYVTTNCLHVSSLWSRAPFPMSVFLTVFTTVLGLLFSEFLEAMSGTFTPASFSLPASSFCLPAPTCRSRFGQWKPAKRLLISLDTKPVRRIFATTVDKVVSPSRAH